MRLAKQLSALEVKRLDTPGMHAVGGVPGLYLRITETGAKGWILRIDVAGKRREMGLGGYSDVGVTLAKARERAAELRLQADKGIDPVAERLQARSALKAAQLSAITFEACAGKYIAAHKAGWKNAKHAQQWENTLQTYAYPHFGSLLVRDVQKEHVLSALEPIWNDKNETAGRVRSRIELVLSYAMQAGYRPEGLNPARWRGGLDKLLAAPSKVARVEHHAAVRVADAGSVMAKIRAADGVGARCLEFAILTACRSGEARGATWEEIDFRDKVWIIPAERMKASREHRVPLTQAAIALLQAMPGERNGLIFRTTLTRAKPGKHAVAGMLSDMTLSAVMKRLKVQATPHGWRSTFRDWAAERTSYPADMAEMALAHTIGNKVEAAYRRGDMFEKRRHMMTAWADFLSRVETPAEVIPFERKAS